MYVKILAVVAVSICVAAVVQTVAAAQKEMTHEGTVVSAGDGKLVMKGNDGKEHSHTIDASVQITVHGKPGKLEDLQKEMRIRVTLQDGKVTAVATVDTK